MKFDESMLSDEMLQLANGNDNEGNTNNNNNNNNGDHGDDEVVRTMEVPKWLSNTDVTKHLVGSGKKARLEKEYECAITLTGHGSGTKDPNLPGFDLDHLLVTLKGSDIRQLGRVRRALEDSLIEYIIENTNNPHASSENSRNIPTPPCLGRLLYALALSSANASPKTKDHTPHRTVLARAHYPMSHLIRAYQAARQTNKNPEHEHYAPPSKKVWMNIKELPQDESGEFHGRFLAGKNGSLLEYYRTKFHCKVDIFGVWRSGDEDDENEEVDSGLDVDPYVLVTSEESKSCVDRCLQFIEYRIREHEEKWGVSRHEAE